MLSKISNKLNPTAIYRAYAVRVTVLGTLSATVAYLIGSVTPHVSAFIAAIIALAAIKPTFHDTVRESIRQVVGTVVGAMLGMAFIYFFGFNVFTLAIIVVISFLTGWILKLRAEGGITIAVTVILVTGPLFGDVENILQRLLGVIIGAICALIASYFIIPGHPHKRILEDTYNQSRDIAKLLRKIADTFRSGTINISEAQIWLSKINNIIEQIQTTREEIRSALEDAKWSPLLQVRDVENVEDQVNITKANAHNVQSICEAIIKAQENEADLPEKISNEIGKMLYEASVMIKEQAKLASGKTDTRITSEQINKIRSRRKKVAHEMRNLDDTQMILLSGTIIHETTNIKDTLEE
jgi:uncharacterized membrane protein YgaE (UPF0421/DUF939 family)